MTKAEELEMEIIKVNLARAAKHIETLLPFARAKRGESGDASGIVKNAEQWLELPVVVKTRMVVADNFYQRSFGQ